MTQLEKMLQPDSQYVFYDDQHGFCINTDDVLMLIEPERKKGEWLDTGATPFTNNEGQLIHEKMCSKCKSIAYFRSVCGIMIADNVCPNCGSDMRGEEECTKAQ